MAEHPAITALRATAPDISGPLPWRRQSSDVRDAEGFTVAWKTLADDADHIAAAVNAAPHLLAELDALRAQVSAAREAVEELPEHVHELGCRRGSWERCACDCSVPSTLTAARRALGLEE